MDAESINTDMENATPETNYFKMMMEDNHMGRVTDNDNMDDSIIGGETLASVMNNGNAGGAGDGNTIDSYSLATDTAQLPNENMSIVGMEDDVSTIANDTINESTKAFFSGHGSRQDSKARIRLFKEYKTPEKKKSTSRKNGENVDDDDTLPETPPGMIRVPAGNRSTSSKRATAGGKETASLIRSKRVYIIAGVLALILFVSIIALSVALKGMRGDGDGSIDSSSSAINSPPSTVEGGNGDDNNNGNDILDLWPDLDKVINKNDNDPLDGSDNDKPSVTEPIDKEPVDDIPVAAPSLTPVPPATASPIDVPSSEPTADPATQFMFDQVLDLLVDRDAVSSQKEIEKNPDSPQYYATSWLSQDPNYFDYTQDRLIQRWALAVLAYSLDSSSTAEQPMQRRRVQDEVGSDVLQGWLTYTDECTWFTSSTTTTPCNADGMYTNIDIQDMMLGGTLPSELLLLSDSLKHIILDGNELMGNIPKEFEDLSNLVSLRLRRNNLDGPLNIDFGQLLNLEMLELGKNKLTGTIPYDILYMNSPTEIHLDYNYLSGTIPWNIGNLNTLVKLALGDNNLSGWVPDSLADLKNLEILTLGNNELSGDLPKEVCRFKNLEVLSVDCDAQGCECCTECASTNAPSSPPATTPTQFPTMSPSASPSGSLVRFTPPPVVTNSPTNSPSASPSVFPTSNPTNSPTECVSEIAVLDYCFEPLADITVSLTNCQPDRDDWVGLFLMNDAFDSNALTNPGIWSWTCGTRNCREAVSENLIALNNIHTGNDEWPLKPGIYVAVLARNSAQPYTAYAVSEAFVIADAC